MKFCTFSFRVWRLEGWWFVRRSRFGSRTKGTFVHCQFEACPLNAFKSWSQVRNEVVSVIDCNANVVHILSTLVRFDDFVKVFSHENWECGQALCQTSLCKCATNKFKGHYLYWALVRHLQPVYAWEQSSLKKRFFPAMCWTASVRVLTGWLLFIQSSDNTLVIFASQLVVRVSHLVFTAQILH